MDYVFTLKAGGRQCRVWVELGSWVGGVGNGRAVQANSARQCGSAGVKRWQWQCCKLMVALRHQMDKQAGALRKLLASLLAGCCPTAAQASVG